MPIGHDIHKTTGPTATPTEALVNNLADDVVRLKNAVTGRAAINVDWGRVQTDLQAIQTRLQQVKTGKAEFELNPQDYRAMLDTLDAVAKKAHDARKYSVLEIIGAILSLGIYAAVKSGLASKAPQEVQRAQTLGVEIQKMKSHADYNEVREPSAKAPTPKGISSLVTEDEAVEGVASHILWNQEMLRDKHGTVDGVLVEGQQIAMSKRGVDEPITADTLKKGAKIAESDVGQLKLDMDALGGVLDGGERRDLASDLVSLVDEPETMLKLDNPGGGTRGAMIVVERDKDGNLFQGVVHERSGQRSHLQFDRGAEIVPGDGRSYRDIALLLTDPATTPKEFEKLNAIMLTAYEKDLSAKNIAPGVSFQQYKLQFLTFDVPDVDQNGLRWHDATGHLNAAEWVALDMRVADLPDTRQHYVWVKVSWEETDQSTSAKSTKSLQMPMPMDTIPADDDTVRRALKNSLGWDAGVVDAPNFLKLDYDGDDVAWEVPGKNEVQPIIRNLSLEQVRALLSDEHGVVRNKDGAVLDLSKPVDLSTARDLAMGMMRRSVNTAMYRGMQEGISSALSDLLTPGMPHTQRIFFRQSNGAPNYDEIGPHKVGQHDVITDQNDTGAFGKCAPISYFSSSICAIGVGASKGLEALKAIPSTKDKAESIERLITRGVLDKDARALLKQEMDALEVATRGKPQRVHYETLKQLCTSVVDRLNLQVDDEGPYFEMTFFYPSGADRGPITVKVRPEDIQQYLETTGRADGYRGGKQHMMDFFKDPSSMHQIDLMRTLGIGAIAVGVDKALKSLPNAPKKDGLLYGPYSGVVESMVYGKDVVSRYTSLTDPPMTKKKGEVGYEAQLTKRRDDLITGLKRARDTDAPISVSMGYSSDNGHVNYVQKWGTPYIGGVAIDPVALARCHMNDDENSASSSAWRNDRSAGVIIDLDRMGLGLQEIMKALPKGSPERAKLKVLLDRAQRSDPADLYAVRALSADVMRFLQGNVKIENSDGLLVPDKVVVFASNTERDNYLSDNPGDRQRVGRGFIGNQVYGSANAADAGYFVPLTMLASGWNGAKHKATRYAHSEKRDHFIMLSSINIGEVA